MKKTKPINLSKFAEICGVSKPAISRAKRERRIVVNEQGGIDLAHPVNQAFQMRAKEHTGRRLGKSNKPKIEAKPEPVIDNVTERPKKLQSVDIYSINGTDALHIERVEKIRKLQITNAATRKELIDRKIFIKFIQKLYAVDTNELTVLCNRVSSSVAAIFDSEDPGHILQVEELLLDDMYSTLENIKNIMNKWLEELKSDGLN